MSDVVRPSVVAVLALVALASGCGKASESEKAKRMPRPPPPESAQPADTLRITVEIDGATAPPIDGARLAALKPDYQDDERRAWRLSTLLGPTFDRAGARVAFTGEKGVTVVVQPPVTKDDPVPVLALTRRGEAIVAMFTEGEPFPAYHGQGGRLARRGDPLPRLSGVTHVKVYVEPPPAKKDEPLPSIEVTVAGSPAGTWTRDTLAPLPRFARGATDAGDKPDLWSLREATRALVGPKARVVAIVGESGKRVTIDPKAWSDPARTPVLKLNRGHLFKFLWLPERGESDEVKGILRIETE